MVWRFLATRNVVFFSSNSDIFRFTFVYIRTYICQFYLNTAPASPAYTTNLLANLLEVAIDEVGDVVIIVVRVIAAGTAGPGHAAHARHATGLGGRGEVLELAEVLHAKLADDGGEEVLEGLGLRVSGHDVGVGPDGGLDLGVGEVDDVAVVLEEVDLLNTGDVGGAELLEGGGQLGVGLGRGRPGRRLLLAAGGALAPGLGVGASESLGDHLFSGLGDLCFGSHGFKSLVYEVIGCDENDLTGREVSA